MSAIFRSPVGLQDYLASKAVGRNPSELLQTVQPVLNMDTWLNLGLLDENLEATGTLGPGPVGTFVNIFTIPDNEHWFVESYAVSWVVTTGICATVLQILRPNVAGFTRYITPQAFRLDVALTALHEGYATQFFGIANPLILYPGELVQLAFVRVAGGTDECVYQASLKIRRIVT